MAYAAAQAQPIDFLTEGYLNIESTGMGQESFLLKESATESYRHFSEPYLRSWGNPFLRFLRLKMAWELETRHLSSVTEIAMHTAYQQIIGMGPLAIPFILAELKSQSGHWFWALKSITGQDPVLQEHRGKMKKMASDWLIWGKKQGYL